MCRRKRHFGQDVFVTRKGAVSAKKRSSWASFPGSMGARSYIVRGKGNAGELRKLLATVPAAR